MYGGRGQVFIGTPSILLRIRRGFELDDLERASDVSHVVSSSDRFEIFMVCDEETSISVKILLSSL